jgi:excinuclease ABC subunit C
MRTLTGRRPGPRARHNRGVLPQVRRLPSAPGVYRFRDGGGRVLYIGRATELRSRVASYWSQLAGRRHLRPMVAAVARVEAVVCDSVHEAAWLERNLLEERLPRWNRTPGGAEVPVYLSLDPRPNSRGLKVTHHPGPGLNFGPYLGGLRARQAASALHRLHPLAYATSTLTGAEREMAQRRGVRAADRAALVAAATAILRREPDAVAAARAQLTDLRDQASKSHAFEHAGRLQSELEALEWIVCPQRATTGDGDFVVHGWADGILVRFTVRGGRVREWSLRRSAERSARTHLAGTPPDWTAYARRNAELAAALISV